MGKAHSKLNPEAVSILQKNTHCSFFLPEAFT